MFNKVVLVGNLTRDIEVKKVANSNVAKTSIAVTRKYTYNGEKKEEVCFIELAFWGKIAEIANQYLKKGSKVLVEGQLVFDSWIDQTGQNRSKHSVRVENIGMLGDGKHNNQTQTEIPF